MNQNKLYKNEKDIKKIGSYIISLIILFGTVIRDKVFLQNIITYLKKVKIKCKKEYDEYTKKIIKQNLVCYQIDQISKDIIVKDYYYILNKIIIKFTNYIIKNIDIDNKITIIEYRKFYIKKILLSIYIINDSGFDIIFSFIKKSKFNLFNKYKKTKEELIKLYKKIKNIEYNKFDKINEKQLDNLDKLCEKYNSLYCKLLKDFINDKEYIKLFINYIYSLKEKSIKDYKDYVKKITSYMKVLDYVNKKIISCFKKSIKKLLKISKDIDRNIKKVETPLEMIKLLNEIKSILTSSTEPNPG